MPISVPSSPATTRPRHSARMTTLASAAGVSKPPVPTRAKAQAKAPAASTQPPIDTARLDGKACTTDEASVAATISSRASHRAIKPVERWRWGGDGTPASSIATAPQPTQAAAWFSTVADGGWL